MQRPPPGDSHDVPLKKGDRIGIDDAVRVGLALLRNGHLDEAEQVFSDIIEAAPEHPDALHFYGILQYQRGDGRKGAEYIRRAIKQAPANAGMRSNLGNVLKELGDFENAQAAYREAIRLSPEHADAHCNLGVVLRLLGRLDDAKASLETAVQQDPEHGEARHNLGNVYRDLGDLDAAIASYRQAVTLYGYSGIQGGAARNLANSLYRSGDVEEGVKVLQEWLVREPDNEVARHMLAAFTNSKVPERASNDYVKAVFDDFASSFDHVLYNLDYKAPMLVADALGKVLGGRRDCAILDLGCGTGLSGALLKPFAKRLEGVDLSPKMLEQARARDVYDVLAEDDLVAYLGAASSSFDVITCVDTFVYFGTLDDALAAAAAKLTSDGWLLFTVESHDADDDDRPFAVGYHGRYSHSRGYLEQALQDAGLELLQADQAELRVEAGQPVPGLVVVARKRTLE